jgi:ADP-ribose pyrophosphatase YjhB (NUDIX family)
MNYSLPRPVFNVRVYGILIENASVLVSDEIHSGRVITKFPGGGLQFGESTLDGLKREFLEELSIDITIRAHFYTVDFFQASAFDPTQQVIGIYYLVSSDHAGKVQVSGEKHQFTRHENGAQLFRWISLSEISADEFTFPTDQKVAGMLREFISQ